MIDCCPFCSLIVLRVYNNAHESVLIDYNSNFVGATLYEPAIHKLHFFSCKQDALFLRKKIKV